MSFHTMKWKGSFRYPGMIYFETSGDGSCLIHALLFAYDQVYRLRQQGNNSISRKNYVQDFRKRAANLLISPINALDPKSPSWYYALARGTFHDISQEYPEYTLDNMRKTLDDSKKSLSYLYLEFIADIINKDIYLLDDENKDILITGEEDLYQKGRSSVVLRFRNSHYETVGILDRNGNIQTLFSPTHDFIAQIKTRQEQLKSRLN